MRPKKKSFFCYFFFSKLEEKIKSKGTKTDNHQQEIKPVEPLVMPVPDEGDDCFFFF